MRNSDLAMESVPCSAPMCDGHEILYRTAECRDNWNFKTRAESSSRRTITDLQSRLHSTQDLRQRSRILELILEAQEDLYAETKSEMAIRTDREPEKDKAALELWNSSTATVTKIPSPQKYRVGGALPHEYCDKVFRILQRQHDESIESIHTIATSIDRLRREILEYLEVTDRPRSEELTCGTKDWEPLNLLRTPPNDTQRLFENCFEDRNHGDLLENSNEFVLSAAKYCMQKCADDGRLFIDRTQAIDGPAETMLVE